MEYSFGDNSAAEALNIVGKRVYSIGNVNTPVNKVFSFNSFVLQSLMLDDDYFVTGFQFDASKAGNITIGVRLFGHNSFHL